MRSIEPRRLQTGGTASPLWVASFILLGLSIVFVFFTPYFSDIDDATMHMIFKGVGFTDRPTEWTLLINVGLGFLISGLHGILPDFPWYPSILVTVLALASWLLGSVFASRHPDHAHRALFGILAVPLLLPFFVFLQYSAIALLAAAIGVTSVVQGETGARPSGFDKTGYVLLVLSSLLRPEMTILGALAATPFLLERAMRSGTTGRRRMLSRSVLAVLAIISCPIFDRIVIQAHPDWEDIRLQSRLSVEIVEYRSTPYNADTAARFARAGWDYLDYLLYLNRYTHGERYAPLRLRALIQDIPERTPPAWPGFFSLLGRTLQRLHLVLGLLLLFYAGRRHLRLAVGSALFLGAMLVFLHMRYKVAYYLPAPLFAFWALRVLSEPPPWGVTGTGGTVRRIALIAAAVFAILSIVPVLSTHRARRAHEADWVQLMRSLTAPDRLFVHWGSGLQLHRMGAFTNHDFVRDLRIYPVSWMQRAPYARAMLDRFGLKDPLRDIVDRPDVFLVPATMSWPLLRNVLRSRYGIEAEPVGPLGGKGCRSYRIVRWDGKSLRFKGSGPAWPSEEANP